MCACVWGPPISAGAAKIDGFKGTEDLCLAMARLLFYHYNYEVFSACSR